MQSKIKELIKCAFGLVCLILGILEIPTYIYRTLLVAIGVILVIPNGGWYDS